MTPQVTCICLTADRQQYTDRAVKCFLWQTYPAKRLLILDNGDTPYAWPAKARGVSVVRTNLYPKTIGALRNVANALAKDADIIAHWDSDDYSHPLRLAWQVQKLKQEGNGRTLDAVGYRSLLFWRKQDQTSWLFTHDNPGYGVGASLAYWRKTWEPHPFKELNVGEDLDWLREQVGYSHTAGDPGFFHQEPAMVAEIHESNTTKQTIPGDSWTRTPEWDERLKELMKL